MRYHHPGMLALRALGGSLALALALALPAHAGDHADTPFLEADPGVDIADVFAWAEGDRVRLALTLRGRPVPGVLYVFHLERRAALSRRGSAEPAMCRFEADLTVECWAGDGYVLGDASLGLTGLEGLTVYTGWFDDPSFAHVAGLDAVTAALSDAADPVAFTCPELPAAERQAILSALSSDPRDAFASERVYAVVIDAPKALVVEPERPLLGVWASTRLAP